MYNMQCVRGMCGMTMREEFAATHAFSAFGLKSREGPHRTGLLVGAVKYVRARGWTPSQPKK